MALTLLAVAWLLTYLLHSTILLGGAWLFSAARIVRSPVVKDTLWKVCLVGGIVTATVQSALPNQPYSRHFLLPSVTQSAPSLPAAMDPRAVTPAPAQVRVVRAERSMGHDATVSRRAAVGGAPSLVPSAPATTYPLPPTTDPIRIPTWPQLLLALWVLGAAVLLVRLGICRFRLARQLGDRREIADGPLAEMLELLRVAAGVRRRIRLTASAELTGPVAMGASEICLPERALTSLSPAEQRAVLAHELGHLVRRDPSWLALSVASESLLFLQPLNRLARRRIQEAAEYLCDDWAVHQTGGSLTLARCLAEVAAWIEAAPRALPISGMAENRSQLVKRVQRLLDGAQPRAERGIRVAVPVAALVLSSVAFAAPGVSPPREQDARQPAPSHVQAARPAVQAHLSGGPRTWVRIRDGRYLEFRSGFGPRITGQGALGIRRGGRAIELLDGQRVLVNGRPVDDGGGVAVYETDTLSIVDGSGRTLWRIEPMRLTPEEMHAQAEARARDRADSDALLDDSLAQHLDPVVAGTDLLDSADVAALARAGAELGSNLGHDIKWGLLPQARQLERLGVELGTNLAPQLARLGVTLGTGVAQRVADVLDSVGVWDWDSAQSRWPRVRSGKSKAKRLRP